MRAAEGESPGGQKGTRKEKAAQTGEVGACCSAVSKRVQDPRIPQRSKDKHLNNTRNMVERAPHRAEAFDAMRRSAERKQGAPTLQTVADRQQRKALAVHYCILFLCRCRCGSVLPPPSSALTCLGWLWFCCSCCCLASWFAGVFCLPLVTPCENTRAAWQLFFTART